MNKELILILIVGIIFNYLGRSTMILRPFFLVASLACALGGFRWAIHEDAPFLWKFVFGWAIAGAALSLIIPVVRFFTH